MKVLQEISHGHIAYWVQSVECIFSKVNVGFSYWQIIFNNYSYMFDTDLKGILYTFSSMLNYPSE